jgi:hypothetical protein
VISSFLLVSRLVQVIPSPYVSGSMHGPAQPDEMLEERNESIFEQKTSVNSFADPELCKRKTASSRP